MQISPGEPLKPNEKNAAADAFGKLGDLKAGPRREEVLSGEQLSDSRFML